MKIRPSSIAMANKMTNDNAMVNLQPQSEAEGRRLANFFVAFMGTWAFFQAMILVSCFGLWVRLILHSLLLWSVWFAGLYSITYGILHRRIQGDHPTQAARIKKVKTIPSTPNPHIQQKTFCWIELVDDDEEEDKGLECSATTIHCAGTLEQAKDLAERDPGQPEEEGHEKVLQDIVAWSHNHPCIIVSAEENVQIGDVLTVHLTNGDPTKPFYRPSQLETQARMLRWVFKSVVRCVVCLVALRLIFGPSVPLFFASSQDVQDRVNELWDQFFPDEEDQDTEKEDEEDDQECHIPPFIAYAYNFLILLQVLVMVIIPLRAYKKTKKFWGMEEPPADSYQLLRGDEDDDELQAKQNEDAMRSL